METRPKSQTAFLHKPLESRQFDSDFTAAMIANENRIPSARSLCKTPSVLSCPAHLSACILCCLRHCTALLVAPFVTRRLPCRISNQLDIASFCVAWSHSVVCMCVFDCTCVLYSLNLTPQTTSIHSLLMSKSRSK